MTQEVKELYAKLEKTVADAHNNQETSIEITERCFLAANTYWDLVKGIVKAYSFETEAAEIYFFKNIKPLFTSTIEYYGLIAHAQLFINGVSDQPELRNFFCRESKRLEKFETANYDFIQYYKSGKTCNDALWFVRANNDGGNFIHAKPYDLDNNTATRYDYLISNFIALKKYTAYLQIAANAILPAD